MKYYAAVSSSNVIGFWECLPGAKTLIGAKRIATKSLGTDYRGHVIHVVEFADDVPRELVSHRLNDMPTHQKTIGEDVWRAPC